MGSVPDLLVNSADIEVRQREALAVLMGGGRRRLRRAIGNLSFDHALRVDTRRSASARRAGRRERQTSEHLQIFSKLGRPSAWIRRVLLWFLRFVEHVSDVLLVRRKLLPGW
jgi:hypothetical protein